MTQIGTMAFDATTYCQSTVVSLTATTVEKVGDFLDAAVDLDVKDAVNSWSDGY